MISFLVYTICMKIFKINPIYSKTIWGGNNIAAIRNLKEESIGTSWEISAHKAFDCEAEGKKLSELLKANPDELLGKGLTLNNMLRVALLDAKDYLSIQVHPDDEYGLKNDDDLGKNECWYVLQAGENATLVAGSDFKTKDELYKALKDDDLEKHLRYVNVKQGDFIAMKNGTLHALGSSILALEISTNSNTTYRFYDFHRKDADGNERELHIEKSMDVVDLTSNPDVISTPFDGLYKEKQLVNFPEFNVTLVDTNNSYKLNQNGKFHTITNVKDPVILKTDEEEITLNYLDSLFIPSSINTIEIIGNTRIIIGEPN